MKTLSEALKTFKTPRRNKDLAALNLDAMHRFQSIADDIANDKEVSKIINALADNYGIELTCEGELAGEQCKYHEQLRLVLVSLFANGVRVGMLMEQQEWPK